MIDEKDKKILQVIFSDGRASVEQIAQQIGLSATPVRHRLQRMKDDGIIRGYRADINLSKCGRELAINVFIKLSTRDRTTIAAFEKRIQSIPEITRCLLVSGPFDYLITVYARDMTAYNQILRTQLAELPGVFGIETCFVINDVKAFEKLPF